MLCQVPLDASRAETMPRPLRERNSPCAGAHIPLPGERRGRCTGERQLWTGRPSTASLTPNSPQHRAFPPVLR